MVYIIAAVLMFGILIAIHELGHFLTAKSLGVRVNEFSIGMGPVLWKKQKKETQYSLRAFPVGGFCAMEGEDELSNDPHSFTSQPIWKRVMILFAGSGMNFLAGFLILLVLFSQAEVYRLPIISGFADGFPLQSQQGLMVGDEILKINGEPVYIYSDVALLFSRSGSEKDMDLVVLRDGKKMTLNNFPLRQREYTVDGKTQMRYGINFTQAEPTLGGWLHEAWFNAVDFVRLVRMGLTDLISGTAGFKDLSGPIGIVGAISQVGEQSDSAGDAARNIFYFAALIAVNLAVMNLLPIPALDGGRIFFLLVSSLITLVTRRTIDPKYEGYIHFAGFICMIGLMVVVAFNDIIRIFGSA
ncbi:MAG: site-2 protease family protein [Oscillospiraceae bacterium]|nr:site-2 protease family protein [Oscillospiraceae bacterium]